MADIELSDQFNVLRDDPDAEKVLAAVPGSRSENSVSVF